MQTNRDLGNKKKIAKKTQHQLIASCVVTPVRKDDEYIYVDDMFRRAFMALVFWKRRRQLTTKDRLIGSLLK